MNETLWYGDGYYNSFHKAWSDPQGQRWLFLAFIVAMIPLSLAAIGPLIGHAWIGHGFYKIALLSIPFAFGLRFTLPRGFNRAQITAGVISGFILGASALTLLFVLMPLVSSPAEIRASLDARYHYTPLTAVSAALFIMTFNALLEEWFYRGFLNRLAGPILASFVFGLQHTIVLWGLAGSGVAILAGLIVVPAGVIWSLIAPEGKIFIPFISHAITDLFLVGGGLFLLGYL